MLKQREGAKMHTRLSSYRLLLRQSQENNSPTIFYAGMLRLFLTNAGMSAFNAWKSLNAL
jgi:hypothetical protein